MSIKNEISRLTVARNNIRSAIREQGVEMPDGVRMNEYAKYIKAIQGFNVQGTVPTKSDLPVTGRKEGESYLVKDEGLIYMWVLDSGVGSWQTVAPTIRLPDYVAKADLEQATGQRTDMPMSQIAVSEELGLRIKTINGKSANPETGDFELSALTITDSGSVSGLGAGIANSIVQEYSLGDRLTAEQLEDIQSGKFEKVRTGGYWTINGHVYWVAHCDYRYSSAAVSSGTGTNSHHVLIFPGFDMASSAMNATDTAEGGYIGSQMNKSVLNSAVSMARIDFNGHIIKSWTYLTKSIQGDQAYDWESVNYTASLYNERMLYGGPVFGSASDAGNDNVQCALFRARKDLLMKASFWLRDISSKSTFAYCRRGLSTRTRASTPGGVRPAFLIG